MCEDVTAARKTSRKATEFLLKSVVGLSGAVVAQLRLQPQIPIRRRGPRRRI